MPTHLQPETIQAGQKLAELRSKTDRDLAALLRRALERGFQLAGQAEYAEAEAVYARAAALLPLVTLLPPWEFAALCDLIRDLRAHIDELACAAS